MRHFKTPYIYLKLTLFLLFLVIYGSIQRNDKANNFTNDASFVVTANNLRPDNLNIDIDAEIAAINDSMGSEIGSEVNSETATKIEDIASPPLPIEKLVPTQEKSVHASAMVDLGKSIMMLFFAGSGEGQKDVQIYQSFLTKASLTRKTHSEWSKPNALLNRQILSAMTGKYIKRIGNPIVFKDSNNKVHLFVVATSLGGWATAKIYQFYFSTDLKQITFVNELHLSPFMNFSHLVRTPAIALKNGGFMLPIYHEMASKFSLVAFFEGTGKLIFSQPMPDSDTLIQPSITAINSDSCLATFRVHQRKKEGEVQNNSQHVQQCLQNGNHWHQPMLKSNLTNLDTSSVLLRFGKGFLLIHNDSDSNPILQKLAECNMTFNDSANDAIANLAKIRQVMTAPCSVSNTNIAADHKQANRYGSRQALSLFYLADTELEKPQITFQRLATIDVIMPEGEVSYPAALIDDTFLHISYTYDRKNIKYMAINTRSIEQLIKRIDDNQEISDIALDSAVGVDADGKQHDNQKQQKRGNNDSVLFSKGMK